MRIFLYVPGMPFNGELIRSQSLGGSETAGYELARALAALGHEVTVFCNTPQAGTWDGFTCQPLGPASPQAPFGEHFERLARTVPHDLLIAQRVGGIFGRPYASQVKLWWTHDLATVRTRDAAKAGLWACQGILAVSEFHKRQVADVLGVPLDYVTVVPNAIEPERFGQAAPAADKLSGRVLVYTSRPERGLEHLVRPGGIMERLWREEPGLLLLVAGYDNTVPELAELYRALEQRCAELPNVQHLGALTKQGVADLFRRAWLHVYPTVRADRFEEVSCISAMEAQAAGTPVLACANGALPETLAEGGAILLPYRADGEVDEDAFVEGILALSRDAARWTALHDAALRKALQYDWGKSAEAVVARVEGTLRVGAQRPSRLAQHLLYTSDVLACRVLAESCGAKLASRAEGADIGARARRRLEAFEHDGGPALYAAVAAHAEAIGNHQHLGQDAVVSNLPRFIEVEPYLRELPPGARVLDYACGVGNLTIAFARRFPHLTFVGADLVEANVAKAAGYAAGHGIGNVSFVRAGHPDGLAERVAADGPYDAVLALEVLEHVVDPARFAQALEALCAGDRRMLSGRIVLTFPMGPMEAVRGDSVPFGEHISHFDHHDLQRMFGHKPEFRFTHFSWGETAPGGEPVGGTLVTWRPGGDPVRAPDYEAKFRRVLPREQVSACLIVRWDADAFERALKSIVPVVDEIVVGIDEGKGSGGDPALAPFARPNPTPGKGRVWDLCRDYGVDIAFALSASALVQGFDGARNETVARAGGEWILWLDADEELHYGQRLWKYLRPNGLEAYAIQQHHFGTEPAGLIKTDLPCRLFRTGIGLKFFGLVHEHPCFAPDQPPRHVMLIPDVSIGHGGYSTEQVRRQRFQRNLPLMQRDRAAYPNRTLGKMLWVRDLLHLARFDLERAGRVTPGIRARAEEALGLWRELLAQGETRLALEALPYVSEAAAMLVGPERVLHWRGAVEALRLPQAAPGMPAPGVPPPGIVQAAFPGPEDARRLMAALTDEALKPFTSRYSG